uniref:NADH dehydrogenase subunit 2 n=1 Tax=Figulus punctatus TaxID=509906 RepID=UPI00286BDE5C|nr:NADH dehydrogenase subunit 2 [Figulus punctatus]WKD83634.1 NADH dehydrogenase subunit 2 [Figulus punctatus]
MWHLNMILFSSSLALGTIMAISSSSWLGMWMGLEINLLSFIPLAKGKNNKYSTEAALKYFITQAMASTIFLFSIISLQSLSLSLESTKTALIFVLNSSILLKMGAAPFHFWFPEVMEGLSWTSGMILLTWQKIAPMVIFIYTNKSTMLSSFVITACMLVSGIMGQNQLSLKKVMAYSSINHIGWMIAASFYAESIWLFYFSIYSIISINIMLTFKTLNVFFMKQLFVSHLNNSTLKLLVVTNFLSLGGLPPFLGFFPKWLTIQTLSEKSLDLLATTMIVATLMTLFFYMQVTFSSMTITMSMIPTKMNQLKNKFFIIFSNLIALFGLILVTSLFNFF